MSKLGEVIFVYNKVKTALQRVATKFFNVVVGKRTSIETEKLFWV